VVGLDEALPEFDQALPESDQRHRHLVRFDQEAGTFFHLRGWPLRNSCTAREPLSVARSACVSDSAVAIPTDA
jgi:hypothetical protein